MAIEDYVTEMLAGLSGRLRRVKLAFGPARQYRANASEGDDTLTDRAFAIASRG